MTLTICMSGRNAVGDGFKDIINSLTSPQEWVSLFPEGYKKEDFSAGLHMLIEDNVSHGRRRIYRALKLACKIRRIVKTQNIRDVFIYFDNHWFNSILAMALRGCGINIFCWVHDPLLHTGANKKDRFIRAVNKRFLFPYCKKIIVSYQKARQEAAGACNIPMERITSIKLPEMRSMEFSDMRHSECKIQYDYIFYGRLEMYKGIDNIVKIAEALHDKRILIIGRGPEAEKVNIAVHKYANIEFVNRYVDDYSLAQYIRKSRFVLLPYITATGSQTVQIANYYGKPVIASNQGCFSEYIENYVNGMVLEFDANGTYIEKIRQLDKYVWDEDKIMEYLESHFSLQDVVRQIEELMEH